MPSRCRRCARRSASPPAALRGSAPSSPASTCPGRASRSGSSPRWLWRRRLSPCWRPPWSRSGRRAASRPGGGPPVGSAPPSQRSRSSTSSSSPSAPRSGHWQATDCGSPVAVPAPQSRPHRARWRPAGCVVRPARNGAAVVLVHGGGGSRDGLKLHAEMLVAHGYGVLLYDERGRGASGGRSNAFGWDWSQDVETAVTYLERRGRAPRRCPRTLDGAEVALTAAAEDHRIAAVVADGTEARTLDDFAHQSTRPTSGRAFPTGPSRPLQFA